MPRQRLGPSGPFSLDSVANLAGLAALGASRAGAGDVVWVASLRRPFVKDTGGGVALAGQVVTCADGSGAWRSMSPFSGDAGAWRTQTDWHIDAVNGTVEGDGSAAHPIDSWRELLARLAGQQLLDGTQVSLHSSLAEVIDASGLIAPPAGMLVSANPGALAVVTGTVGTYTAESLVGSGTAPLLTSAEVADWTPYEDMRIRFTDGAAAGGYTWIAKANPAGAGVNVARVPRPGVPVIPASYPYSSTPVTPAPGDGFVIETLAGALGYVPPPGSAMPATIEGIAIVAGPPPGFLYVQQGCMVSAAGCSFDATEFHVDYLVMQGCLAGSPTLGGPQIYANGCSWSSCLTWYNNVLGGSSRWENVVAQAGISFFGGGQHLCERGLSAWDNPGGPGILVGAPGTWVQGHFTVYGSGNSTYGVHVPYAGSGLQYDGAHKPIIVGTTANARIAAANYAWGAIPATAANLSGITTP
jgi:hypothetical protein